MDRKFEKSLKREKPKTTLVSVRLPDDVHKALVKAAKKNKVSQSRVVVMALRTALGVPE